MAPPGDCHPICHLRLTRSDDSLRSPARCCEICGPPRLVFVRHIPQPNPAVRRVAKPGLPPPVMARPRLPRKGRGALPHTGLARNYIPRVGPQRDEIAGLSSVSNSMLCGSLSPIKSKPIPDDPRTTSSAPPTSFNCGSIYCSCIFFLLFCCLSVKICARYQTNEAGYPLEYLDTGVPLGLIDGVATPPGTGISAIGPPSGTRPGTLQRFERQ